MRGAPGLVSLPAAAACRVAACMVGRPGVVGRAWGRVKDYTELTKPRILVMALVAVAVGALLAGAGSPPFELLAVTLLGTGLVAAGASVFNQVLECDTDALMQRTRHRPLPSGRMAMGEAVVFGVVVTAAGLLLLAAAVNLLTALLAALTLVLYVAVYTPLKRRTSLNTVIGAIPGALPPVLGWAAVRGTTGPEAWALFLIVFLWQFPHFLAIAWMYRDDYARAGLRMLPVLDPGGGMTARQMIGYSLALVPASLAPTVIGMAGLMYFCGALSLGCGLLGFAFAFAFFASAASARNLMRASLVYLPALLVLMMFDMPLL